MRVLIQTEPEPTVCTFDHNETCTENQINVCTPTSQNLHFSKDSSKTPDLGSLVVMASLWRKFGLSQSAETKLLRCLCDRCYRGDSFIGSFSSHNKPPQEKKPPVTFCAFFCGPADVQAAASELAPS